MKLFISYGHQPVENVEMVTRIRRDLEAAGHECWIDSERIREGQSDWRRSLMDALRHCEWTVGFLSRHAMRPGGVTSQEVAIAQDHRNGCLTTVLLDPLDHTWSVPVSVGHAQWVDMSDWRARRDEGEAAFEAWYAGKRADLLERLSEPLAARYAGEMKTLEEWLRPVPQFADIKKHLDGFVGREWLAAIVEDWRLHKTSARMFWLTGHPGTGKSAFSAWMTRMHQANVVALNLCLYDFPERRDPRRVVRTLAHAVARRVQDYRTELLRLMPRFDAEALDRTDATTLFDRLLIQPLTYCLDGGRSGDRLLLVVDGLDEAVRRAPNGPARPEDGPDLVELLAERGPLLPDWVGLLVTSRPEQPASDSFGGLPSLRIEAEGSGNDSDLRLYARGWLGASGRPAAEVAALVEAIVARASGSFTYLRVLREAVDNKRFPLDRDTLPDGLGGIFTRWFKRQFSDASVYGKRVEPLLGLILAATGPVPDRVLAAAMGWDEREAKATLQSLGSLFERRDGGWTPFHKSLRDWLTDPAGAPYPYTIRLHAGHERLAATLWRGFVATAQVDPSAPLDAFTMRELPAQATRRDTAGCADWVREAGDWHALATLCARTVERLRVARDWDGVRQWCDLSDSLALAMGEAGLPLRWRVAAERGDRETLLGRTAKALAAYRAGIAIAERLAAADPGNAAWQRGLSVSHDRIGNVLVAQGDRPGALAAYRAGMAIRERLAAADPGNAEWQRDLSISHNKVGDVLMAQGDGPGALAAYRPGMAIRERLAAADPGNAEWQRDLSVSHDRVGDVLVAQGDRPGALAAYRAGMAIADRLAAADPGNAEWQRDLSISHERVGDVLVAQGDRPGALAAYRAGMAIRERLAAADPGNAEWQRDLSISHERVGDVLVAQDDRPGALEAYRAGMAIRERLAAADPGNAEWQRDLSVSHDRVGDVLVAQDDLPGALAAYRAGMAIAERLAAADPGNAEWQRDLSVSHERIGDVLVAQGDRPGALAAYRAGMVIRERLAVADPGNAEWQRDLFVSLFNVTRILLDLGERNEAYDAARRLDAQARLLHGRFPHDLQRDDSLRDATDLLARARAAAA